MFYIPPSSGSFSKSSIKKINPLNLDSFANEKHTAFRLYNPTGMSNHLMSLENGIIAQYITNRPTIIYNSHGFNPHNWDRTNLSPLIKQDDEHPTTGVRIYELVDIPNEDLIKFIDFDYNKKNNNENYINLGPIQNYFFNFSNNTDKENEFSQGRKKFILSEIDHAKVIHFESINLSHYSYLLMNRSLEIDTLLSKIKWKNEYTELSKRIAKHIGSFNGAHIRMTDHAFYKVDEEKINYGLEKFDKNNKTIIVCTDDPENSLTKLSNSFLLNEIINNEFSYDFKQLPFQDNIVYGLICMLVMTHADDFIGTPGSTYTGLIHRALWKRGKTNVYKTWKEDCNILNNGSFTWNKWKSTSKPDCDMWWREWPECILKTDSCWNISHIYREVSTLF